MTEVRPPTNRGNPSKYLLISAFRRSASRLVRLRFLILIICVLLILWPIVGFGVAYVLAVALFLLILWGMSFVFCLFDPSHAYLQFGETQVVINQVLSRSKIDVSEIIYWRDEESGIFHLYDRDRLRFRATPEYSNFDALREFLQSACEEKSLDQVLDHLAKRTSHHQYYYYVPIVPASLAVASWVVLNVDPQPRFALFLLIFAIALVPMSYGLIRYFIHDEQRRYKRLAEATREEIRKRAN